MNVALPGIQFFTTLDRFPARPAVPRAPRHDTCDEGRTEAGGTAGGRSKPPPAVFQSRQRLLVLVLLVGFLDERANADVGLLDVLCVFVAVLLAADGVDGDVVQDDILHRLALVPEDP